MNNLRKFNTVEEFTAATLNYPAVSWVVEGDYVYFDKSAPTPSFSGLTVYYNISDISQPTELFKGGGGSGSGSGSGGALPSEMIIDGTAVEVTNTYQFSTTGEHIVQYSFADNAISKYAFYGNENITSIIIGNGITSIGIRTFKNCRLTSLIIPNSVTNIDTEAFYYCSSLSSITVNATNPPALGESVFEETNNCPIYVPSESVEAYKAASGWSDYSSRIQAIP